MISIQFNTDLHKDGLGAQLQRQVATFCLAKYLNVNFLPSEIKSIDFNPGDGITDERAQESLLTLVNANLSLNGTKFLNPDKMTHVKLANAPTKLWKLKVWFALSRIRKSFSDTNTTFIIDDPYIYVNQNANLYKKSKYFKFRLDNPFSDKTKSFNIAMHIPRAKVSPTSLPERYQPTNWYLKSLEQSLRYLGVGKKFVNLYIHTDAPTAPTEWVHANKSSLESQEYWKNAGILDENGRMTLNFEDFNSSFSGFLSLKIIREVSPIIAWQNISHCDVFILGKSSFSFIGALFNSKGLKISPIFFVKPPNNWILLSDDSSFSFLDRLRLFWVRIKTFKMLREIRVKTKMVIHDI